MISLTLAGIEVHQIIGISVLVITVLSWFVNYIQGNTPDGVPRQQPRPNPKPQTGRSEIEELLQELSGAKRRPKSEQREQPPRPPKPQPAHDDSTPNRQLQMRILADVQFASPLGVDLARIGTDNAAAKTIQRQVFCQAKRVRTTSSHGERPGKQKDRRLDFRHGARDVRTSVVAAAHSKESPAELRLDRAKS